jgi:hypothetical protein
MPTSSDISDAELLEMDRRSDLRLTPDGYAQDKLGMTLHPKQAAVLRDLFTPRSRVSLRKANEVGGTRKVVCAAVLYALDILEAEVISTAGKWLQVQTQLVPALKSYSHLFPKWDFLDGSIKIGGVDRYIGFSTNSGFAQGFHKTESRPLVAIIDEAGLVEPGIFADMEDRCSPDHYLIAGAPMDPVGPFYDAETVNHRLYTHHHISQMDCLKQDGWWIDVADIQRKIDKYGSQNHPFVQSNVFGEFSMKVENALVSLKQFNDCLELARVNENDKTRHAFVDVAGGVCKNVFAVRHGNRVWIERKWVESSEMATCGEVLAIAARLKTSIGLKPEEITIDAGGAGKPMADRLREMGLNCHRFTGQSKPRFDFEYANSISEVWGTFSSKIKSRDIVLPNDDDLRMQVLSRTIKRNSSGKFQIESKEDYCGRGMASPDEADACAGCSLPSYSTASDAVSNLPPKGSMAWHSYGQKDRNPVGSTTWR